MGQLIAAIGTLGTLGIMLMVLAFNMILSATFLGAGILFGNLWRIIP